MSEMDVESKIKHDMRVLGCTCDKQIALTYMLYMHLVDQKLMYDTEYCFNKDISCLYVVAKPNKHEKTNIYVPIATCDDLCMDYINELQINLCTVETGLKVNLALVEGDSTIVIYSFSKGLLPRPQPDKVTEQRMKEQRRSYINNELAKNRRDILSNALNGGAVDD